MGIHLAQHKKTVALVVLLAGAAFGQNSRLDNVASGPRGPIPFATVAVCSQPANTSTTPCSPLVSLCSSITDVACIQPNPLLADSLGNYHFYAKQSQGLVTIQIYGPQVASPLVLPDQAIPFGSGSSATLSSLNGTQFCDQAPGANAGAKLNACVTAAASSNGIADARGLLGAQTATAPISVGNAAGTTPVTLFLGAVTLTTSATITVYKNSAIVGLPASSGTGTPTAFPLSNIVQANGANLAAVVQCGDGTNNGNNCVLQDIGVDGNQASNAGALDAVLINKSSRYEMSRVTIRNARRNNLRVFSTVTAGIGNNESCCGKIFKLSSQNSFSDGIYILATADVFLTDSESENNGQGGTGYGLNCLTCGGLRAIHNDFGGNPTGGISLGPNLGQQGGATGIFVVANQFGANLGHAITLQGWDSTLGAYGLWGVNITSNNIFANSVSLTTNTFDGINIIDSRWNTITGNVIQNLAAGHVFRYGVNLVETAAGRIKQNAVISNPMDTLFGTGTFTDNGSNFDTSYYGNPDLGGLAAWRLSTPYLRNNDTIKWADSTGALFSVFQVGTTNKLFLLGHGTAKDIIFQPLPATTAAEMTQLGTTFSVGIGADGSGFKHKRFGVTCSTTNVAGNICTTTESWTTAFADANYTVTCSGVTPTGTPSLGINATQVAASVTVSVTAITGVISSYGAVDCIATHD